MKTWTTFANFNADGNCELVRNLLKTIESGVEGSLELSLRSFGLTGSRPHALEGSIHDIASLKSLGKIERVDKIDYSVFQLCHGQCQIRYCCKTVKE